MNPRQLRRDERGIMLVTALLFLVILTLLGISMFRSSGLMDHIAANTREKQRSFEAAQAALQYGEWWLRNNDSTPAACTATGKVADLHVCEQSQVLPDGTFAENMASGKGIHDNTNTQVGFEYNPANMTQGNDGGLVAGTADVNYKHLPGVFIEFKGVSYDGQSSIYRVTGYGYGGSDMTNTVLQSTYQITANSKPVDQEATR